MEEAGQRAVKPFSTLIFLMALHIPILKSTGFLLKWDTNALISSKQFVLVSLVPLGEGIGVAGTRTKNLDFQLYRSDFEGAAAPRNASAKLESGREMHFVERDLLARWFGACFAIAAVCAVPSVPASLCPLEIGTGALMTAPNPAKCELSTLPLSLWASFASYQLWYLLA